MNLQTSVLASISENYKNLLNLRNAHKTTFTSFFYFNRFVIQVDKKALVKMVVLTFKMFLSMFLYLISVKLNG